MSPEGVSFWRADRYRVSGARIEAETEAIWRREGPVAFYTRPDKARTTEGPHLSFLKLRSLVGDDILWGPLEPSAAVAIAVFATEFGLLGAIQEKFVLPPVPPPRKLYVVPEAVVDRGGRLRRVDAEEGAQLLLDLLNRQFPNLRREARSVALNKIAHSSEVMLLPRSYSGPWSDPQRIGLDPVRWNDLKERYGGLLVLDQDASARVSVLCTGEPLTEWGLALADFPSGELRPEDPYLKRYLNSRLTDVSPFSPENEEGFRRGWRCSSLLQAMRLMLWLDLTGGRFLRECGLRDCHNFFREGSQGDKTLYCSDRHTSLASTRLSLGDTP